METDIFPSSVDNNEEEPGTDDWYVERIFGFPGAG
jgi:hypothetical protein